MLTYDFDQFIPVIIFNTFTFSSSVLFGTYNNKCIVTKFIRIQINKWKCSCPMGPYLEIYIVTFCEVNCHPKLVFQ